MKTKILLLVYFLLTTFFGVSKNDTKFSDPIKEKKLLELVMITLKKSHFDFKKFDDNFSKAVFKNYMFLLDSEKKFLLESDYLEFKKFENELDNQILNNDLIFFYLTYDRMKSRMREVKTIYSTLAKNTFDFSTKETYLSQQPNFAKNANDLKNIWHLRMKKDILDSIVKQINIETIKLKLDSGFKSSNFKDLELKFRDNLINYLSGTDSDIENLEREDFFDKYLNAILIQFDPHTKYLKPFEKLEQSYLMSGQYVGLGTQTAYNNNFLQVYKLEQGGPAYRDKKLEVGDLILKFQEGNGDIIDLVGLQLLDYNKLVAKVNKNTLIKLTVKKPDGTIKIIPIKKDIVEIGNTFAKSCIVEKNGMKFGLINLPKFYKDFSDSTNRDAAKDVEKEIQNLKNDGVQGILLDLRDNGGGSVEAAIEMAGLFLGENQIVQLKSNDQKLFILKSNPPSLIWDGHLVILINKDSASATEIFSAAIQDYKRAIVVGSKSSFGKGTLQNNIDLNQFISASKTTDFDFGSLCLTTQKFYRITGQSTQNLGVVSDIEFPTENKFDKYGEQFLKNSFPNDKIEKLSFNVYNNKYNFQNLINLSKKRISENLNFKLIEKKAMYVASKINLNSENLNIDEYRKKIANDNSQSTLFEDMYKFRNNLIFKSSQNENKLLKKDDYLYGKRKNWHNDLSKDVYVDEAINILIDMNVVK